MTCVDENHFYLVNGEVHPQPWMQERRVATVGAEPVSGSYGVSGGWNKNDLLQSIECDWINDTPLPAWVYGEVSQGGTKVTLQARSQGWIATWHGYATQVGQIPMHEVSRTGVGIDVGRGGFLGAGTELGIAEKREYGTTNPLCPFHAQWHRIEPGNRFFARVDVRFTTAIWEGTDPDGGAAGTESVYEAGALRLDLFAVPIIE